MADHDFLFFFSTKECFLKGFRRPLNALKKFQKWCKTKRRKKRIPKLFGRGSILSANSRAGPPLNEISGWMCLWVCLSEPHSPCDLQPPQHSPLLSAGQLPRWRGLQWPATGHHKSRHFLPLSPTSRGKPVLLQAWLTLFPSVHNPLAHTLQPSILPPPRNTQPAGGKTGPLSHLGGKNVLIWPSLRWAHKDCN